MEALQPTGRPVPHPLHPTSTVRTWSSSCCGNPPSLSLPPPSPHTLPPPCLCPSPTPLLSLDTWVQPRCTPPRPPKASLTPPLYSLSPHLPCCSLCHDLAACWTGTWGQGWVSCAQTRASVILSDALGPRDPRWLHAPTCLSSIPLPSHAT